MAFAVEEIVGRPGELRAVEAALDELERGRPTALEIEGEPGIGKTRLLAELARRADERAFLVLDGAASELEREVRLWVFADALDDDVSGLPPAVLAPLGGPPRWDGGPGLLPEERHRVRRGVAGR